MKQIIKFTTLLCFATCLFVGCYYDKKELVYPITTCDSTNAKFSTIVLPILNTNCNNCHGGAATAGAGIMLDNYTNVKTYSDNKRLINSILQNGQASPMPKAASKLADCDINKINAWINAGALNN